jgi:hypothetical protein
MKSTSEAKKVKKVVKPRKGHQSAGTSTKSNHGQGESAQPKKLRFSISDQDVIQEILKNHQNLKSTNDDFADACEAIRTEFEKFRPGRGKLCTKKVIASCLPDSLSVKPVSRTLNKKKKIGDKTKNIVDSVKNNRIVLEMTNQANTAVAAIKHEVETALRNLKPIYESEVIFVDQREDAIDAVRVFLQFAGRLRSNQLKYSKDLPGLASECNALATQCDQCQKHIRDAAPWISDAEFLSVFASPLLPVQPSPPLETLPDLTSPAPIPAVVESTPRHFNRNKRPSTELHSSVQGHTRRCEALIEKLELLHADNLHSSNATSSNARDSPSSSSDFKMPHASDLTIQQQMENVINHQRWKTNYLGNVGNTFSYVYIHGIRDVKFTKGVDPEAETFLNDFLCSEKN